MWSSATMMHTKVKGPSIGTTFDSCTTQDSMSMRQMRLLWAAADGQLKAEQVAGGDALARGAAKQLAMPEEKLQQAEEGRARSVEAIYVATARAAAAEAAVARTRGAEAFAALAEAEAERQRLKAEVVRLEEVKRVLAREAAVTQQEASEAYLRCFTRCQAQVLAAKAAEAESRRAEAEAEKSLAELKRQLQAAEELLQRQVQATEAVMAAAALTTRVAARCMRERALAHAWGAWRHASWQKRLLAASGARLRLALRVAVSFAAWRASWAKANEAGREKQRKAEKGANEALLAAANSEREDLRRQLAALKARVAAEREAAAVEKRERSDQLTNACSKLLNACRSKEELRKEAPDRTPTWLRSATVNTRSPNQQKLRVQPPCWGGAAAKDPTPTWLRSAAVILRSPHAEAPAEPDEETEVAAEERQVASRPQPLHAVSGAVAGRKLPLPHEMPLVQQVAAKAAAVAQAREQTGWQSPRALRTAGVAPAGLPVTLHQAASYCPRHEREEPTTTRFIVVEEAGASGLSTRRTTRRLALYETPDRT